MLMKVSMSLEMWMQCGPSHVKCGCNVDPPHLHILKVDVMWMYCGAMWISTFQMWINADILWVSIMAIYVNSWINSKLMWTATLKMWIHHISTSWQCGSATSPHFHNVEFPHLHIRQFDLYPLSISGKLQRWAEITMIVIVFWSYPLVGLW